MDICTCVYMQGFIEDFELGEGGGASKVWH